MDTVVSTDGTQIAYDRRGAGPPLILVHGAIADSTRWKSIQPAFGKNFSVYSMDRRGHGASGDRPEYDLQREFEDVAAVVDTAAEQAGEAASVLGHSFGAVCALEAGLLTHNISRLILYEPSTLAFQGHSLQPDGILERLDGFLESGDRESLLKTFLLEVVRMPPEEFEYYRTLPPWPARVAVAHTLPRELRALEKYRFVSRRFKDLQVPALLLLGGDSPPDTKAAVRTVDAALPDSRIVILPGQQHVAMDTAPELFLKFVKTFLTEL
jgi:pimeloyl-ACP methyl ester carboxylesterase